MKLGLKRCLFLLSTIVVASSAMAATIDEADDLDQRDIGALRDWINTKRQVTIKESGGALSISGEVRTEFQHTHETANGVNQRGPNGVVFGSDGLPIPSNGFDIEVNLMFDYRTDRSWAAVKLEFDNEAGIISGTLNKLKLERAIWGYRIFDRSNWGLDVELGRRRMSSMLDSKLEFNSFFDGVWFKYGHNIDPIGSAYLHAGVFLVNEWKEQFGYVGEIGLLNLFKTGFYTKYSVIDWDTKKFTDSIDKQRFDFIVSQLIIGYRFNAFCSKKPVQIYLAGLYNHKAQKLPITDNQKANWGTYLGVSMGELKKKGDWAFDINGQLLAAQCVPDFDVSGIGTGNASSVGFYTVKLDGKGGLNTVKTAGGNVNYQGYQITLDYLFTNQIDVQLSWMQSISLNKHIGPYRRFRQLEVELIYGF
ncbi:MAG: hypothetical protein WBD50_06540 [Candidatus Rhabdochlamydia sp.]